MATNDNVPNVQRFQGIFNSRPYTAVTWCAIERNLIAYRSAYKQIARPALCNKGGDNARICTSNKQGLRILPRSQLTKQMLLARKDVMLEMEEAVDQIFHKTTLLLMQRSCRSRMRAGLLANTVTYQWRFQSKRKTDGSYQAVTANLRQNRNAIEQRPRMYLSGRQKTPAILGYRRNRCRTASHRAWLAPHTTRYRALALRSASFLLPGDHHWSSFVRLDRRAPDSRHFWRALRLARFGYRFAGCAECSRSLSGDPGILLGWNCSGR